MALADPMVGSAVDRAKRICRGGSSLRRRGVVISRIPGASHCAMEATIIGDVIRDKLDVPVVEIEVPSLIDAMEPTIRTRLEALVETVRERGFLTRTRPLTTMICAGIDAGSRTTKVVLLDGDGRDVVAAGVVDQGIEQDALAESLLTRLLRKHRIGRKQVGMVVATGYGRKLISVADATITEITCQAWGVRRSVPEARTIIDIGGQDSKLLRLNGNGAVGDFMMNDRCAAGTGRFLELLATRLGVRLARLGELAGRARMPPSSAACASSSPRRKSSACWPRVSCRKTLWPACRRRWPRGWRQ